MDNFFASNPITGWQFLQEPLYKWFLFLFALSILIAIQRGVLGYMK